MISRSARYRPILFEHGGDILASREMQFEHIFMQHGTTSCYTHSVNVACMSLWLAERLRIRVDRRSMVRGALLHDFFLYYMLRFGYPPRKIFRAAHKTFAGVYDDATIKKWLTTFMRRFFTQQFKRSCLPDGPKVGTVTLSPRGDWRMPSDAVSALWLKEAESL